MHKYLETLKQIAKSKGGKLISTEYINSHSKYRFIDELGNEFEAAGYAIKNGRWSPHTAQTRKILALTTTTIKELQEYAKCKGGECLSTIYINPKTKYHWKDSAGREFWMNWGDIKFKGQWSQHEKSDKLSTLRTKYSIEILSEFAQSKGGQLLSTTYTRLDDNYEWIDRNGVQFTRTWSQVLKTEDLLYNVGGSKPETDLVDFVASLGINVIRNDRRLIKPQELDIYIPSHNLAIEFNGLIWHSEHGGKNRNYHLDKMNKCNELGINLIQIFENEWRDRKPQVKSFLKSKLGKNSRFIYARRTQIKEVSKSETKKFLNDYHILGNCNHVVSYGLYLQDELLSLITIGKHHRNNTEIVLSRFVGKEDVTVVGGLSKLVKHASSVHGDISTWIDLRWSDGQSWKKIGWEQVSILSPDYFYFNPNKNTEIYSKQQRKKSSVGTPEYMTEWEHAQKDGLTRIWDCGKLKLVYKKSNT